MVAADAGRRVTSHARILETGTQCCRLRSSRTTSRRNKAGQISAPGSRQLGQFERAQETALPDRAGQVRADRVSQVRVGQVRAPQVRADQLRAGQVRAGQVRELHIVLERRTTTELEDLLAERMDLAKTARRSRKTAAERKRDLEALVAAGPPRPKQRAKYCEYLQAANKLGGDPVPISSCTPNSIWALWELKAEAKRLGCKGYSHMHARQVVQLIGLAELDRNELIALIEL